MEVSMGKKLDDFSIVLIISVVMPILWWSVFYFGRLFGYTAFDYRFWFLFTSFVCIAGLCCHLFGILWESFHTRQTLSKVNPSIVPPSFPIVQRIQTQKSSTTRNSLSQHGSMIKATDIVLPHGALKFPAIEPNVNNYRKKYHLYNCI